MSGVAKALEQGQADERTSVSAPEDVRTPFGCGCAAPWNDAVESGGATESASLQSMKYQLVLQWPASAIKDYDAIIAVENALVEKLTKANDVDGHDAGSGEVNIFIRTDDAQRAFNEVKAILGTRDFWVDARVAYRAVAGSEYTILWPKDLTEFNVA